jgi:hypothetical protein
MDMAFITARCEKLQLTESLTSLNRSQNLGKMQERRKSAKNHQKRQISSRAEDGKCILSLLSEDNEDRKKIC